MVAAEQVPGVQVATAVAEAAEVYREILVQAERLGSDVIVMGTHGDRDSNACFSGRPRRRCFEKPAAR